MKKPIILLLSSLGPICGAHGGFVFTFGGASIPDLGSKAFVGSVSTATGFISSLTVSLSITGENASNPAYTGDLYVTLQHGSGFAVLLNRPGKMLGNSYGYGDNGLNITLDDSGSAPDVHTYQMTLKPPSNSPLTGTWSTDGRNVDPKTVLDTTPRTRTLLEGPFGFRGLGPNGDWLLFVADLSAGGTAKLASWTLNIETTPVPEPAWGASLFAIGLGGWLWWRRTRRST